MAQRRLSRSFHVLVATMTLVCASAFGQTPPANGVRPAEVRRHALTNARIILRPGSEIAHGTIVIGDGVIEAVGENVVIPPDAWVHDLEGQTVTAGFIDAAVFIPSNDAAARASSGGSAHWNHKVTPQVDVAEMQGPDDGLRKDLRALGFTTAAIHPASGIFRGSGSVIALADDSSQTSAIRNRAAMGVAFEHERDNEYPGSLMGAIALVRQTFADAAWHATCRDVYARAPRENEPPIRAAALEALADAIARRQLVMFDCGDELNLLRAASIAKQFSLKAAVLGSGTEFRWLDEVVASRLPIVLPLAFPQFPDVASRRRADRTSLRDLMTWEQAPTNPVRLVDAGATIAFTTYRLKKRDEFFSKIRQAMAQGLTDAQALAALTTAPASILGIGDVAGTIEPGKLANLAVFEGPLFQKDTKVRAVWVTGRKIDVKPRSEFPLSGGVRFAVANGVTRLAKLDPEESSILFPKTEDRPETRGRKTAFTRDVVSFLVEGEALGLSEGLARVNGVVADGAVAGEVQASDGQLHRFKMDLTAELLATEEPKPDEQADPLHERVTDELVFPLGEFGLLKTPQQAASILITNAAIWTCSAKAGDKGFIEHGWLRVIDGKVKAIGEGDAPSIAAEMTIDAAGRHVTPGLIDCHSHTGISGNVNEGRQANTAEVSIGDVVDPDDIDWYRQLAGGLTACNQLHGSANPIGGRNSVVKLRWGSPASAYPISGAKPGIKFALGENVVRDRGRYPNTRMGVEQFFRDTFMAAKDYAAAQKRYAALDAETRSRTMPPRPDHELDVIVEILEGKRIIHCHSYRQDEILMLIRLADEFGFKLGTLQHILEGYKVGEALAAHGVGASSFSDWWAYKMEVMDAIPYNGAILHDLGVVVSFNSDSNELARRMNTEASKAVRYGSIDPVEALRFVTLNPAKQLRVDDRVGSLEPGKDADFVIWSGDPLSSTTRCEQTWIEGTRMFSLEQDEALRHQRDIERTRLLDKVLRVAENEKAKRRRERNEKEEKAGETVPAQPAAPADETRHIGLLARSLEMRRERYLDMMRRGLDPDQARPGDCGCESLDR